MKIAYISDYSPMDVNNWSGTAYYIYKKLSEKHTVEWLGGNLLGGAFWHHKFLLTKDMFYVHDYSPEMGKMLSEAINAGGFDLVISSNYVLSGNLDINVPFLYFTDIVYILCKNNYAPMTDEIERRAISNESRALRIADRILFSSEAVRRTAIDFYSLPPEKISVVEFGANIPEPQNVDIDNFDTDICRLTFVGRDWKRKGGDKMLQTFRLLRQQGFPCELTIIGSQPPEPITDEGVTVIPLIDKHKDEDIKRYDEILRKTHFMVLPTLYDAFGILFCEASAYGVPSIAPNVGGVGQPIRDGVNGFLLAPDASPDDYAQKIKITFTDRALYTRLRHTSRQDYEQRLNWNVWGEKVEALIAQMVAEYKNRPTAAEEPISQDVSLPVYAFNLKSRPDRLANLKKQFADKPEFDVTYIIADKHENGAVGLWQNICKAVRMAQQRGEEVVILCEDDHEFTEHYNRERFVAQIAGAYRQGAELLNGGIGGFGTAVPISPTRYWVDWFWCTQFIVIFAPLFPKIVTYNFLSTDTADGVLSKLSHETIAMFPPISTQKNYGYSDITQHESQTDFQNNIFAVTNERLKTISEVYQKHIV